MYDVHTFYNVILYQKGSLKMQHKRAEFFENDELTIDVRGVREVLVDIVVAHQCCSNQRSYRTLRNLGVHHYK